MRNNEYGQYLEQLIEDEARPGHEVPAPPRCPASSWSSRTSTATRAGFFLETYHERQVRARAASPGPFVQDNHSRSVRGTLRGLHAQVRRPQGKLVRAVEGEMFDVAVDIRQRLAHLRPLGGRAPLRRELPPALHPARLRARLLRAARTRCDVEYKCTDVLRPGRRDRRRLGRSRRSAIAWPISEPIVSAKDRRAPRLAESARRACPPRALAASVSIGERPGRRSTRSTSPA